MVELQDGNPNAALDQVRLGEELAPVPGIQAHAEYVRGLVARRDSKAATQAIEHFRKANEVAGGANLAPLALESGLALGETLLASGQPSKAADVLTQVSRMGAQLRNPVRERAATALLAQAQAALKNFEAAIQAGSRVLQLTRELKFTRLEAVDLYNLAFFNLQVGHATEAVSLFRQARKGADATDANFQKELLFHLGVALVQIGERGEAERALSAALKPSNDAKDWRKVLEINKTLSDLAVARNDRKAARAFLETAVKAAEASDQKEERKALVRKLKQIDG
jgi:tetratricopeptide (TPR) repeat protein